MLTTILATLLSLQTVPQDLYKLNYEQNGMGEGTIRLIVEPQNGFKWGGEYNAVLTLHNNSNVTLPKRRFTGRAGDFSQEGRNGFVDIPFKLRIFNDQIIEGTIDFLICNKTRCTPQRNVKIRFEISGEPGC
jgi:hypothetical protein